MAAVKIVVLGPQSIGKTTLVHRLRTGQYKSHESTIGAAFMTAQLGPYHYHIWDCAGSERFTAFLPLYVRGAQLVLLCFDATERSRIQWYFESVKDLSPQAAIILVGTRFDGMEAPIPAVDAWAEKHRVPVIYTSALVGSGIAKLETMIIQLTTEPMNLELAEDLAPLMKFEGKTSHSCCCLQ